MSAQDKFDESAGIEADPATASVAPTADAPDGGARDVDATSGGRKDKDRKDRGRKDKGRKESDEGAPSKRLKKKAYAEILDGLQIELVKMQEWIRHEGLKVAIVFEGRDAAGKGGAIKAITQSLNPRYARVVALPAPNEREKTQWYFQRYAAHLPSAGEMVLFDRSWYNRAGVERVMGFASQDDVDEFMRSCPEWERMLVRSGIQLIKYWFSVSDEEQERRFQSRIEDPTKRWKLSPMDLQARSKWVEFSKAKDDMFAHCDIEEAPWWVVPSEDQRRARLNCISHLLSLIPYGDLTPPPIELPPRQSEEGYVRPPMQTQRFVPEKY